MLGLHAVHLAVTPLFPNVLEVIVGVLAVQILTTASLAVVDFSLRPDQDIIGKGRTGAREALGR